MDHGGGDEGDAEEEASSIIWPLVPVKDPEANMGLPRLGLTPSPDWGTTPFLPGLVQATLASREYYVITGILLLICSVIGATGNGIIIGVVLRRRLFQTVTHILVMNLAAAHFLLSMTVTPIQATMFLQQGSWPGGSTLCRIVVYLHAMFSSAAILTLSTIAIDRYYSVVYPLDRKLSLFKGKLMIFYVWFHAMVVSLPKVFVSGTMEHPWGRIGCDEYWDQKLQGQVYLICYAILTIFGPLLVTCLAYCFVWRAFRISQRKVNVNNRRKARPGSILPYASRTEARLLKMLFLMVFCFVTLWAPYVVYLFLKHFSKKPWLISEYFILTSTWICKLQPILDPLIYGYLNKQFRQSLYLIMHLCHIRCTCPEGFISETTITSTNHPYTSDPSDHIEHAESPQPEVQCATNRPNTPPTIRRLSIRGVYIQKDVHYSVDVARRPEMDTNAPRRSANKEEGGKQLAKQRERRNSLIPVGDLNPLPSTSEGMQGVHVISKKKRSNRIGPKQSQEESIYMQGGVPLELGLRQEQNVTVFTTSPDVRAIFQNSSMRKVRDPGVLQTDLSVYPGDIFLPRRGMLPPISQSTSTDRSGTSSDQHGNLDQAANPKRKRKKILSRRLAMKHKIDLERNRGMNSSHDINAPERY